MIALFYDESPLPENSCNVIVNTVLEIPPSIIWSHITEAYRKLIEGGYYRCNQHQELIA